MIYAVIALSDNLEGFEGALEEVDGNYNNDESPNVYFVQFRGTSKELFNAIKGNNYKERILILRVHEYYGRASANVWEWLDLYTSTQ